MTRAYRLYSVSLVVLSTLLSAGSLSEAALIQFVDAPPSGGSGTDYRIDSIAALDIGGTLYDVSFHHGVSFDSITDPIAFNTVVSANGALDAVIDFINGAGVNASSASAFTSTLIVPYESLPLVQGAAELNVGLNFLNYSDGDFAFFALPTSLLLPSNAYLTFAVSTVPEPSALWLGVMAVLATTGWCRWRRHCVHACQA